MAITLTPFEQGSLCRGCTWAIPDEDELARLVARVLLGQARHVAKIIAGTTGSAMVVDAKTVDNAIALMTVPTGKDPWHRDGLLFQIISWIAACRGGPAGALARPPHLIPVHKGFDGLQIELDADGGSLAAVVIFEDKATDNPRVTIREEVWPEFTKLENGDRQNLLMQEVTALLETRSGIDVDGVIESIVWKGVRHYRVSITVGDSHADEAGRKRLFDGYGSVVVGDVVRRRGETIHLSQLRSWMEQFSERVIAALKASAAAHV